MIARRFRVPDISRVPAPGAMEFPVATMRSKEWAERRKLEPPCIEFSSVLSGGNETADVGTPIGNAAQARIDCNRNMSLKCLPSRLDVSRPQKCSISLHAGIGISVERSEEHTSELQSLRHLV